MNSPRLVRPNPIGIDHLPNKQSDIDALSSVVIPSSYSPFPTVRPEQRKLDKHPFSLFRLQRKRYQKSAKLLVIGSRALAIQIRDEYCSRYSVGVSPVQLLNIRLNWLDGEKPT